MSVENDNFVTDLYRDVLYRAPTTAELSFYGTRLDSGFYTKSQVAHDLLTRTDYQGGFESLTRLYQSSFNRMPDYGGLMYWNGIYGRGVSLNDIAKIFHASPEFKSLYGTDTSNAQYVRILYQNVLGRLPDPGGEAFWLTMLNRSMDRGEVLNSFAQSKELKDKMVDQVKVVTAYALLSKRVPTSAEISSAGTRLDDMLVSALRSSTPGITWSSYSFVEGNANDGSFTSTLSIRISGDTFKGVVGATLGSVSNVPAGLTASLTKINDTEARLALTGKATAHAATNSITNLTVTFTGSDTNSGATPPGAITSNIRVTFIDLVANVSGSNLTIATTPSGAVVIDLPKDLLTLAATATSPTGGEMSAVTNADLSGVPKATSSSSSSSSSAPSSSSSSSSSSSTSSLFTFIGGPEANIYKASPLGDTITSGGGADVITLGAGADTVVMPETAGSTPVTIKDFKAGTGGDVLKVSSFLVTTKTSLVTTSNIIDTNIATGPTGTPKTWVNGDVILAVGNLDATKIASMFADRPSGAVGFGGEVTLTDNKAYLAAPNSARKAVMLTADVTGNTYVWYITNSSGSGVSVIAADEVKLAGVIEGVNTLDLAGFIAGNFS